MQPPSRVEMLLLKLRDADAVAEKEATRQRLEAANKKAAAYMLACMRLSLGPKSSD